MHTTTLTDVFDIKTLQQIQDSFSNATGMAAITVDLDGSVTKESNFTDFCIKYTRGCEEGSKRCNSCDLNSAKECKVTGKPAVYHCHAGLIDFSVPIIVNGEQLGSILGGQVLSEKPDEEKFRAIAVELGINPDEYIEALRKVPIVPEDKIRSAAELLSNVVNSLAVKTIKYGNVNIDTAINDSLHSIDNFYVTAEKLNNNQNSLINEMNKINELSKEINNVAKAVSSIADETQMISFNASIEAARVGEQGKSFTVIANAIRQLAEQSKQTVANIQHFTANIEDSISKTSSYAQDFSKSIDQELKDITSIKDSITKVQLALKEDNDN